MATISKFRDFAPKKSCEKLLRFCLVYIVLVYLQSSPLLQRKALRVSSNNAAEVHSVVIICLMSWIAAYRFFRVGSNPRRELGSCYILYTPQTATTVSWTACNSERVGHLMHKISVIGEDLYCVPNSTVLVSGYYWRASYIQYCNSTCHQPSLFRLS